MISNRIAGITKDNTTSFSHHGEYHLRYRVPYIMREYAAFLILHILLSQKEPGFIKNVVRFSRHMKVSRFLRFPRDDIHVS
ncbi:MAG: hypothetical protein CVV33_05940 [Methanomicrobiales archaeon HGW-Methanomicrobiales-4]|nr:MAG: hypothetical protein CVV33_05940 [Methanomicrobiales archaeon HGW-Methanomicrobiales-4]